MHVLPRGFHHTCRYGLLASATREANIVCVRALLTARSSPEPVVVVKPTNPRPPYPCCSGWMRIIRDIRTLDVAARVTPESRSTRSAVVTRHDLSLYNDTATPLWRSTRRALIGHDEADGDPSHPQRRLAPPCQHSASRPYMSGRRTSRHRLAALYTAP